MFSLILKNCGFHRTFRPFATQVRSYKHEVAPEDLNKDEFYNKFDKYNIEEMINNDNKIELKNKYDIENEKWTDSKN